MSHAQSVLRMKRKDTPLTANRFSNDDPQKARVKILKSAQDIRTVTVKFGNEHRDMAKMDTIVPSVQMGNITHT